MKTVFYTICSDSHWQGCRTDEFISSFKHFHPDIDLRIFGQKEIDREFSANPGINFYNSKAHFAKLLYNDYDLVVNIDADHIILGRMDEILKGDYDVACPANYNISINASIELKTGYYMTRPRIENSTSNATLVMDRQYFQGGLVASTKKSFWDAYNYASVKHAAKLFYAENDILNLILTLFDYKVKYLEGDFDDNSKEFTCYYGCSILGKEMDVVVDVGMLKLSGRPLRSYHFAWGGKEKAHPKDLFSPEVVDFIYSKIINA